MIGIMFLLTAISQGTSSAGLALGAAGVVMTAFGFRFGFCPICTIANLLAARSK